MEASMDIETGARETRQAWIDGVNEYHPSPKASYTLSWGEMAEWERKAVITLYKQVRATILPSLQSGVHLPAEHGGYLVCSIWNALMFQLLHDPNPSYVKHFDQLDEWQRKTDIKMFEAIERSISQEDRISA